MVEQKMVDYIRNFEAQKYKTEQIRSSLLQQGYSALEIDQAIAVAHAANYSPQFGQQISGNKQANFQQQYQKQQKGAKKNVPRGIKIIAIYYYLSAALLLLLGLGVIALFAFLGNQVIDTLSSGSSSVSPLLQVILASGLVLFVIITVFLFIFAIISFVIARGLWKGKNWARILVIIFTVLSVLGSLSNIVMGNIVIGAILLVAYGYMLYYLIAGKGVKEAFAK